jgi:hypothetical protein
MNMELPESSMQEVFVDKSHAQPFLDLPSEWYTAQISKEQSNRNYRLFDSCKLSNDWNTVQDVSKIYLQLWKLT